MTMPLRKTGRKTSPAEGHDNRSSTRTSVSELLLDDRSIDQALQHMASEVSRLTLFPVVLVQLFDDVRQKLFFKSEWGLCDYTDVNLEFPSTPSSFEVVLKQQQPMVCLWPYADGHAREVMQVFNLQTMVCVPVYNEQRPIGMLLLGHNDLVPVEDVLFSNLDSLSRLVGVLLERRRTEQMLHEAERFLGTALDSLTAHIAILDSDGTIITVNEAWRQFADANGGISPLYSVGLNYIQVCNESTGGDSEEAPVTAQGLRDVIGRLHDEFYIEYPCHSPTQKRWFTMRATRFEWGGYVRLIVSHQNVTEFKLVVEQLRENQSRLQGIMDNVADGIVTTDENGTIEAINPSGAQIFGGTQDELIGKTLFALIDDGDNNVLLSNLLTHRATYRHEVTGYRLSGESFPMYIAVSDVHMHSRRFFTAILQDLTDRKRVEKELLETERLRLALDKEKELRELKSRFVSTMSHELRTPLAAIRLANDMLIKFGEQVDAAERAEYTETIRSQSLHLTHMVNDILRLSKTESVGPEFRPEPVSMDVICRTVLKEIQMTLGAKHAVVFINPDRPINGLLDENLVYRALVNLMANAVKYSPEGTEIRLELSRIDHQIIIRVCDHGIGIPEEDLENLFQPFHRAANAQTIYGTGLGLYIVKQAVEMHNGTIGVETKVGQGTIFTIRLPA